MFFDNLIKEMAICINVGDTCINRDLELFSYRGKKQNIGFDTPGGMLSDSTLTAIDLMLSEAMRQGLTGCNSRIRISDFIKQHTDLTDCHLCALNDMMSLQ